MARARLSPEAILRFLGTARPRGMSYKALAAEISHKLGARCSRQQIIDALRSAKKRRRRKSPIMADTALRRFIDDRLGLMPVSEIIAACRRELGTSPSKTAIYRYWQIERQVRGDFSDRRTWDESL